MKEQVQKLLIRCLIRKPIEIDEFDWDAINVKMFMKLVARHSMFGWIAFQIKSMTSKTCNTHFGKEVSILNAHLSKLRSNINTKAVISQLYEALRQSEIKGVVIKGPALCNTFYKNEEYIHGYSDIDLLVDESVAKGFHELLLKNYGFHISNTEKYNAYYTSMFCIAHHLPELQNANEIVEVHHRLGLSFVKRLPKANLILKDAQLLICSDGVMYVPIPYDSFIILCNHLFYHHSYENSIALARHGDIISAIKFFDVAFSNRRLEELQQRVQMHGVQEAVFYSLYQTQRVFKSCGYDSPIRQEIIDKFTFNGVDLDAMRSRYLLEDKSYGTWTMSYYDRVFFGKDNLEKEVGYAYYKQTCQKRWKKSLESLSIDTSLEMW